MKLVVWLTKINTKNNRDFYDVSENGLIPCSLLHGMAGIPRNSSAVAMQINGGEIDSLERSRP